MAKLAMEIKITETEIFEEVLKVITDIVENEKIPEEVRDEITERMCTIWQGQIGTKQHPLARII